MISETLSELDFCFLRYIFWNMYLLLHPMKVVAFGFLFWALSALPVYINSHFFVQILHEYNSNTIS